MRAQQQDIRRRLDGSIDIDFYRQRGLMERRTVMRGFFRRFGQVVKPLAAVAPTASVAGSNKVSLAYPTTAAQLYALHAAR
jgi:hypothetical protein